MAKYTISAGCGHTVEQQLFGKDAERARRIEWMQSESGKCNACYAAMKRGEEVTYREQKIAANAAKLVASMQANGLSPDQVATIRGQLATMPAGDDKAAAMKLALVEMGY